MLSEWEVNIFGNLGLTFLEHYPGEGHAHLYVDGQKIARLYGKWYHIEELSPGQHEITVTLNANDHREYAVNGENISTSTIVVVP